MNFILKLAYFENVMEVTERRKPVKNKEDSHKTSKATENVPLLGAKAELPFIEKIIYAVVFVTCFVIAVYKIYMFPLGKLLGIYQFQREKLATDILCFCDLDKSLILNRINYVWLC